MVVFALLIVVINKYQWYMPGFKYYRINYGNKGLFKSEKTTSLKKSNKI